MKKLLSACIITLLMFASRLPADPGDETHLLGPDSLPQPGTPQGKVTPPTTLPSQVYPGTIRNYRVYVPAQYDPAKPACLMVFNDGHAFALTEAKYEFRMPQVLDNLIYKKEIPVIIGVFVDPGRYPTEPEPTFENWGKTERNSEYGSMGEKYPKFVIDELMPEITRQYNITKDPEGHAIVGNSSGGIAAFNVAWERPDMFRKVISCIGAFGAPAGQEGYADLIMKNDPKPIRIFIQDTLSDNPNVNPDRDLHKLNVRMVESLTAKKYDLNYAFGVGKHSSRMGGAIMPDMVRWLWRDWPRE